MLGVNRTSEIGDAAMLDAIKRIDESRAVTQVLQPIKLHGDVAKLGVSNIDQYFGLWAVHEQRFGAMLQALQDYNLDAHVKVQAESTEPHAVDANQKSFDMVRGDLAVIELNGTMTKRGSSFSRGGTIRTRRQIDVAMRDPDVAGIMLAIESPGGTVAGTKELADMVAQANSTKPTHVFIEDIGASAAYYVASQAGHISANEPAMVGSIGTFMVLHDGSEAAAKAGVQVHVIRAGAFKGVGTFGTEVTPEQIAEFQSLIESSNELFLSAVKAGRKFNDAQMRQLADGRVHLAKAAVDLSLIDSVGTFDQALDRLADASNTSKRKAFSMSQETKDTAATEPRAATLAELKAACPGADSDFLLAQMEANATTDAAQRAFIAAQQKQLSEAKAESEKTQARVAELEQSNKQVQPPGNPPLQSEPTQSDTSWNGGNATAAWNNAMREKITMGIDRLTAANQVVQENPGLREAYLAEQEKKSAASRS